MSPKRGAAAGGAQTRAAGEVGSCAGSPSQSEESRFTLQRCAALHLLSMHILKEMPASKRLETGTSAVGNGTSVAPCKVSEHFSSC